MRYKVKKIDFFIVLVSLIVMFVVLNAPFKVKPLGDLTFHQEAKTLSLFIKGAANFNQVTLTKAPGPVLFYTPVYMLVPEGSSDAIYWRFGVVYTFIFIIMAMLLIYRIGSLLFSKEVALLSVLLFFIFPIHFYYTMGILAEAPAFVALTIAIYGWSKVINSVKDNKGWLYFVLGIWFLILNRPNSLLFLPLGVLVVIYAFYKNKIFFKNYGKNILISIGIITVLSIITLEVAKFITRDKSSKNQSELFYYVAHQGRFQFREEPFDLRYWESDIRSDSKDYQNWKKSSALLVTKIIEKGKTYDEVYRNFLLKDVLKHPIWFLRQSLVKVVYGQLYMINSVQPSQFELGLFKGKAAYICFIIIINSVNILILFGFLVFLFKDEHLLTYWPLWSVIIALLLFHAVTYMEPRYLFPMRITLYLMSAAGLLKIKWIHNLIVKINKKIG